MNTEALKLLVVEDEVAIARDIAESLANMGYYVIGTARSGEAATDLVSSSRPDLILMDIVLAGEQDGITTASQIWKTFQIPTVYLTAYADEKTLKRAKKTHAFGYVLKPFTDVSLKASIEIAISQSQKRMTLQRRIDEAVQRNQTYAAIVAHEFRNLLSTIQSSCELLELELSKSSSDPLTDRASREMLQAIQHSTFDLSEIVEDVLMLVHSSTQTYKVDFKVINVVEFCQQLLQKLDIFEEETCRIRLLNLQPTIISAIDQKLLSFILNNLLSNALKYSDPQTTVSLIVGIQEGHLEISVRDQGIGIPEDHRENLFKPFQRADNVGNVPGTGIGLVTVKRCVDLHRGAIAIDSTVGVGTVVTMKLPLNPLQQS